jgi:hypothetical protein
MSSRRHESIGYEAIPPSRFSANLAGTPPRSGWWGLIRRDDRKGRLDALLTRNSYGSVVLNAANVMFVDAEWLATYERAAQRTATCRFVEAVGWGRTHDVHAASSRFMTNGRRHQPICRSPESR